MWWIKRDFRLADNEALCAAINRCDSVLGLFIIEPELCAAAETSLLHYHAWRNAAMCLSKQFKARGGRLIVRVGEPENVLESLRQQYTMDALFSHQETGSAITFRRDGRVRHWCQRHRLNWFEFHQNGVVRGEPNRDIRQQILRERLFETAPIASPPRISAWSELPTCDGWPDFASFCIHGNDQRIQLSNLQAVSEASAQETLHSFLFDRGIAYSGGISSPNSAFTAGSRLSVHLAWGTISLRYVFSALDDRLRELRTGSTVQCKRWRKSLSAFRSRLHWHDHFMQRLESAPQMEHEAINPAYRQIHYRDDASVLEAWSRGTTGLPLVDACIRCLAATGFLNFRMRAMLVTTGCFGLAQSWQSLQYPLARVFLDYEPGIHFSQIQMQAGIVGINTLRVYSPQKQLIDQDPEARFVKQWIPELRSFSADAIRHYPHRSLGDYPKPIVDIDKRAKSIKDQIYAVRQSEEGRCESHKLLQLHGSRMRRTDRNTTWGRKFRVPDTQLSLDFD